jgi:hypothetical protein
MKTILCCLFSVLLGFLVLGGILWSAKCEPLAPEDKEEK